MVPLFVVHRDKQARWQLQHSGALTLAQMCDQDGLAVGKLKGVMVNVWLALVDMLKLGDAVSSFQPKTMPVSRCTSLSKASSVPGSKHTATFRSSTEAKPRVDVWGNLVDINLSPTFAGRDATTRRL